ncbi:hypothetical protein Tco_1242449 [Tanacetum coccineum]
MRASAAPASCTITRLPSRSDGYKPRRRDVRRGKHHSSNVPENFTRSLGCKIDFGMLPGTKPERSKSPKPAKELSRMRQGSGPLAALEIRWY